VVEAVSSLDDIVDIDIGEEGPLSSWLAPEVSDIYPQDSGPQVLGKRRTMDDSDQSMDEDFSPQKKVNLSGQNA